jgi:hypothetical protein
MTSHIAQRLLAASVKRKITVLALIAMPVGVMVTSATSRATQAPSAMSLPIAPPTPTPTSTPTPAPARALRHVPTPALPTRSAGTQKRTAFIVGISNAPGAAPLPGSKTDALTVRDALLKYGFPAQNITMLLDGQATRSAILSGLAKLAARSMSGGIAVVSITTHASTNATFRAWDGRVSARELGTRLGRVRGRLWTTVATCYAGGFAVPGVVGSGRIGVFSSSARDKSWQVGSAGSYVIRYMVKAAMVEGDAPDSVESAFAYAKKKLHDYEPDYEPLIKDGVDGDLRLGPVTWLHPSKPAETKTTTTRSTPKPTSTPSPSPGGNDGIGGLLGPQSTNGGQ